MQARAIFEKQQDNEGGVPSPATTTLNVDIDKRILGIEKG
jgi:hypothetical protein